MFSSLKVKLEKYWIYKRQISRVPFISHKHDLKLMHRIKHRLIPRWHQLVHVKHLLSPKEGKILRFSLLVLAIGLIWAGYNFVDNYRVQVPDIGGRFVEAVIGSPQFINPIFASTNDVDMDITRLVYSGLMRYDEKNRLVMDLASKYEISEDKKIYTFELKKDVVWHDNEPFTARDIIFTIETIQNNLVNSPLNVSFQGVKVVALDDYTVRFVLPESFIPFLSSLTVGILPEHVWFNVPPEQMRLAQTNIQPIGTGPFMFKKFSKDESGHIYTYELARFERYYRQPAFFEEFVFQFYSAYDGEGGAVQDLRSSKITALSFVPKNLREKVERKHITLNTLQIPQYTALFFNQSKNTALKDKNVREALVKAIDKDRILREALNGEGQVISGPILPGFPGYNPELVKLEYSFSQANELLDKDWVRITAEDYRQARENELLKVWEEQNQTITTSIETTMATGTELAVEEMTTSTLHQQAEAEIEQQLNEELNAAQTFYRKNKAGELLELNLVTVGTKEYQQTAELTVGFWQELGIKTNVKYVDARNFSRDVLKEREYDILLYGIIVGSDPDQYPFWHSSQVNYPGLNLASYVNRNVDALIDKARETTNEEELITLYQKFQEIILSEYPAIFLYTPTYTYATLTSVQSIDVVRISHPADRFADVVTWYIDTKGQWNFKKL